MPADGPLPTRMEANGVVRCAPSVGDNSSTYDNSQSWLAHSLRQLDRERVVAEPSGLITVMRGEESRPVRCSALLCFRSSDSPVESRVVVILSKCSKKYSLLSASGGA